MNLRKHFFPTFSIFLLLLSSCGEKTYSVSSYKRELTYHDNFNIVHWTDIHLGMESDTASVYETLDAEIADAKERAGSVDLLVITGDTFLNASKAEVREFVSYVDGLDIPFAFTYGNHDFQGDYDKNFINNELMKAENNLLIDYADDNIFGKANYYINLTQDGAIKYRIFVFDSNSYYQGGARVTYDIIHDDQLDHLDNIVKEEGIVPALAFYHIPVYEYADAYKLYKENSSEVVGTGENNEGVSVAYKRTDAFERMKNDGVIGMFVGHDHINYSTLIYQDVLLSYGVKSTYEIYDSWVGYSLITLHGQDTLSLDDVGKYRLWMEEEE